MTQVQELDSINTYVLGSNPKSDYAKQLQAEWTNWYSQLAWYNRTIDSQCLNHAREFKKEYDAALSGKTPVAAEFGAETKASGNFEKPGSQVPTPAGFRRATQKEITKPVLAFVQAALTKANPNKLPQGKVIGKRFASVVDGKTYVAQVEWHYDNHPNGSKGNPFWHMGMSTFIANNPVHQINPFPVADRGLPQGQNPYA